MLCTGYITIKRNDSGGWSFSQGRLAALAATGSLPENVNYAVKSSLPLSLLESVPDVAVLVLLY
jgi:hypothetical protein